MQRRGVLAIVCASAVACLTVAVAHGSTAQQPLPPETVLPAPAIETVGKAATPWMRSQLKRLRGPLRPASHPRSLVVARLRLALSQGSGHVWFVTYRSQAGRLCGVTFEGRPFSSAWATGGLPCLGGQCGAICSSGTTADLDAGWLAYSATAPRSADGFRLTLADGSRFRFPLTGPPVRGAPDRRVVIVQLSSKSSVALAEALQGEQVIASQSYAP